MLSKHEALSAVMATALTALGCGNAVKSPVNEYTPPSLTCLENNEVRVMDQCNINEIRREMRAGVANNIMFVLNALCTDKTGVQPNGDVVQCAHVLDYNPQVAVNQAEMKLARAGATLGRIYTVYSNDGGYGWQACSRGVLRDNIGK